MAERSTGRESDKFMLRFPEGMRDRIKAEAERNGRSMNAEIIARLDQSMSDQDQLNRFSNMSSLEPVERIAAIRAISVVLHDMRKNPHSYRDIAGVIFNDAAPDDTPE